ncbi:hypothetical protein [Streptococcus fryi]
MKKKLILVTVLAVIILLLLGMGKLYIGYNLSRYAGYYVQHMPRREGVKPELAILVEHLHDIDEPKNSEVYYDLDGNGAILLREENIWIVYYSIDSTYVIRNYDQDDWFAIDEYGQFAYYENSSKFGDKQLTDDKYRAEAQAYLDKMLPPILKAQKQPDINLQWLFNQKYEKRFN